MRTLLLYLCLASCAFAQFGSEPPPVLQLIRAPGTSVYPGGPYAAAKASIEAISLIGMAGVSETWTIEAHQSFASIEVLDRAIAAVEPFRPAGDSAGLQHDEILTASRALIALYRPTWSYRPADAVRLLPRARYFEVTVYRIRPAAEAEFGTLMDLRRATSDVVNLNRPDLAYQVVAGAPGGTIVVLSPLTTLGSLDEGRAPLPPSADALAAARAKDGPKIVSDTELGRENLLFRVEPSMSYVSDEFAAADSSFWRGRN